jgi:hypothetical protein
VLERFTHVVDSAKVVVVVVLIVLLFLWGIKEKIPKETSRESREKRV